MHRILIWGCVFQYNQYINAIRYHEVGGGIKIVGITAKDKLYTCLDGYPFIPVEDVSAENVDYVVVTSERYYRAILTTAIEKGFCRNQVLLARIFCLPYFDFNEYIELLQSKISIVAMNCWGGYSYHTLGMEFASPFINLHLLQDDFIRLLNNFTYYMKQPLQYERIHYDFTMKKEHPVALLDDVELYLNHYSTMEEAEQKWNTRITRLNMDNLFVMMYTQDPQILERFDKVPFDRKVCFVPFESSLQSAFTLQAASHKEMREMPFYKIVNRTPVGYLHDYNLIRLLLHGVSNHDRYYVKKE